MLVGIRAYVVEHSPSCNWSWICWWAELEWFVVVLLCYSAQCDLNGFNAFLQALPSLKDWVVYFCKTLNEMTLLHDHHCTMVTSSSSCSCGSAAYSKFWSGIVVKKMCLLNMNFISLNGLNLPKPRPQYHGMALHFARHVGCVTLAYTNALAHALDNIMGRSLTIPWNISYWCYPSAPLNNICPMHILEKDNRGNGGGL